MNHHDVGWIGFRLSLASRRAREWPDAGLRRLRELEDRCDDTGGA
ncbi:hypothetical protein ACFXD5_28550 [Streptomyces sp. NPDC059385]